MSKNKKNKPKKNKNEKLRDAVHRLEIATGVIAIIWTLIISAGILTWMGMHFIHYDLGLSKVKLVFSCFGITLGALLVLSMGIYEGYYAFSEGIGSYSSIALGIWFIIITGVLPGVLYFITMGVDRHVPLYVTSRRIPAEDEEEKKTTKRTTTTETKKPVTQTVTKKPTTTAETKKPVTQTVINKPKTQKKKDPRKYFIEDENDVGLVPEIKPIDFEDLDN